jgi:prepilin-type N-terminal cleavage/methylation domain-containing protein/prepilin-type processing-associated H-X9-DG protein
MVRAKSRAGFTLVELLVVIGIIALLIGILLPALTKARKAALEVVCASNMHQWGIGIQIYADQSKGELPQKGPDGSTAGANAFTTTPTYPDNPYYDDPSIWFNAIPPFVNGKSYFQLLWDDYQYSIGKGGNSLAKEGDRNIFICPAAGPAASESTLDQVMNGYFLLYGTENPNNPQQILNSTGLVPRGYFKFASSYVFNSKLTSSITQPTNTAVKMSMLRPTSEVVVMVEKLNQSGEYKIRDCELYNAEYPKAYNSVSQVLNSNGYVGNIGQSKADWRRFTTRHRNGGFLLYADGHVAWSSWLAAQIQPDQMPGGSYNTSASDANQPGKMIWSVVGPVN